MTILYDEVGNEIEALTEDEVNEKIRLKEEELKSNLAQQLETEKARIEEEIKKKQENKELNFKNLRESKEELENRLKSIEEQILNKSNTEKLEWERELLNNLSGGDEETAKKIKYAFDNEVTGETNTKEQYSQRMLKAVKVLDLYSPSSNPINLASSISGITPKSDKDFSDTEEGIQLAKDLGFNFVNKK